MLNIDLQQTIKLLGAIDEDFNSFTFQVFHDTIKDTSIKPASHFQAVTPGSKASNKLIKYNNDGYGAFFQPNKMDQSKRRRLKEYVNKIRAVWCDLDKLEESPIEPVKECNLKPHIIIESSPGKWHCYWLVEHDFDISLFEPVQATIAARFNGDKSMAELNRVMRLPGFYHQKKGGCFQTRIIEFNEFPKYTEDEIIAEFPPTLRKTKKDKQLPEKFSEGEQHNSLLKESIKLQDNHYTKNEIIEILKILATTRGHRVPEETELEQIAEWTDENIEKDEKIVNDHFIAEFMAENFSHKLKFCYETREYMYWNGAQWVQDSSTAISKRAATKAIKDYIDSIEFKKESIRAATIRNTLTEAKKNAVLQGYNTAKTIPLPLSTFDQNPYLLNVNNGTVDMRTGELKPFSQSDYITRKIDINYNPKATSPKWEKFLKEIMLKDELIEYLQIVEGYCTTGITKEQLFWIYFGSGGNGKSVFINTLKRVRGDYSTTTNSTTFAENKHDTKGPNPELLSLKGFYDVTINETSKGFAFDGNNVKNFVDSETPIKVRGLYTKEIEYKPTGKLRFITNAKPRMKVDGGFRRRIKFVPFTVKISEEKRNKNLYDYLYTELEGILNWLVQGAIKYFKQDGIIHPASVDAETENYLEENEPIALFLKECCIKKESAKSTPSALYNAYTKWTQEAGEHFKMSVRHFKQSMEEKGFTQGRCNKIGRYWEGIGILEPDEEF